MTASDTDLFAWWAIIISAGTIFHTLVSIYLYTGTRAKREKSERATKNTIGLIKNFAFVWVLLGLLVFYIVSIQIGSDIVFAAGNIFVETILIVYLIKNRVRESG